jgi:arylsulfatase A-like enzyme
VVYDLAERVSIAEREARPDVLLFGTPAAEPRLAAGFFRWSGGTGDRFVWARREVEVALEFEKPEPRAAVVDLRSFEGVREQRVRVLLNGREIGRSSVGSVRQRLLLKLPAEAQRPGENRLRFEFAGTASAADVDKASSDGGQLAAAFYSLTLGRESDASLVELLGRDAPRPFGLSAQAGVPGVSQLGASSVRHVLTLPAGAELRFKAELHPAAVARDGSARASVSAESVAGRARELWSRVLTARDPAPREVALALPGVEGEPMAVTFRVEGERSPWVVWRAPRVLGRSGVSERRAASRERALGRLRAGLAGKSVVFVILDAARARQLGCYGYPRATTPELDRLASEGVLFENAVTPAVYTVGAMSSIWTSQQPDEHHGEASFEARLPSDRLTLAELLQANGVRTAGFVANAMAGRALGFERGFEEFRELYDDPALGSRAEIFRKALPAWLARHQQGRFFLYVHFREPHFPYDPPPEFRARFGPDAPLPAAASRERDWYVAVNRAERQPSQGEIDHLVRLYDANLAYVDREVGELRKALEAASLLEDVVFVIAADHGEQLYEHGYISHSAQLYEESVKVPLIVRFPKGAGPTRARIPGLADLTDIAPTIADVFGVLGKGGSERSFAGRSLLTLLAGAEGRPALVSRSVWERPLYAVRDRRFKLIRDTREGREELFDLERDPGEKNDLLAALPLRAAQLRQQLFAFLAEARSRPAGSGGRSTPTPEQCENMRTLGYVGEGCK